MKLFRNFKLCRETRKEIKQAEKEKKRCAKQYSDWKDDEYNCGPLKFIWGLKSYDDLSSCDVNFYSMNDIDIYFNRDTQKYILGIETIFKFESQDHRIKYLERLLKAFKEYMSGKFDSTFDPHNLYLYNDGNFFQASSLTELYYKFEIFVTGYSQL